MPNTPTPRLGLPRPVLTDPADVPFDTGALADKLDQITATFLSGPASALPAPGTPGRLYLVTDQALILYDSGSRWLQPGYAPGDLKLSATGITPVGWLVCDGSPVARTDYPDLFAAIGVVWGAGDGSSTFNLPDLRGRALVGVGTGTGLSARALGARFGEEAHVLALTEIPSHNHGGATGTESADHQHLVSGATGADYPDHTHNVPIYSANVPKAAGGEGAATVSGGMVTSGATARHQHDISLWSGYRSAAHTHAITAQGGGAAHNVMQPSAALTMHIKT